ncbi:hypothetical protein HDU85_004234 [Gaertneriomyces sp. JEL0708]|nr:hypothetical protein HDU85_004234 [Gaertneriomyces sp. JEL0708]
MSADALQEDPLVNPGAPAVTERTPLIDSRPDSSAIVEIDSPPLPLKDDGFTWKTFAKFIGPGYMVAVGYLDPGNWATDLAAGSQFGYRLLFIILLANVMAVLLQSLCIKLGVVTGRDLAQACRKHLPPAVNIAFYVLCELAIIATDVAEVIGTAIALKLLFNMPLPLGVVLTSLDVLVILFGWDAKHLKYFEWFIMLLMATCGICFAVLITQSGPKWADVFRGYVPSPKLFTESGELYIAMGIIGATVMPHNLYLHSSIVKYRSSTTQRVLGDIQEISDADADDAATPDQPIIRKSHLPIALWMTNLDSIIALTFALTINSAILIVSSANFFESGRKDVAELEDAYALLKEFLGWSAGTLFAVALLFAGQSSTITGTMAGQIIMEGFLGSSFRLPPWLRRLVTRVLAIIPAMIVSLISGDRGVNELLVLSQVILSLQLPFAVWPLVYFTSSKKIMTVRFSVPSASVDGQPLLDDSSPAVEEPTSSVCYASSYMTTIFAIIVAALITIFNLVLIWQVFSGDF